MNEKLLRMALESHTANDAHLIADMVDKIGSNPRHMGKIPAAMAASHVDCAIQLLLAAEFNRAGVAAWLRCCADSHEVAQEGDEE